MYRKQIPFSTIFLAVVRMQPFTHYEHIWNWNIMNCSKAKPCYTNKKLIKYVNVIPKLCSLANNEPPATLPMLDWIPAAALPATIPVPPNPIRPTSINVTQ